jgi:hypothetical protein
MTAPSAMPAPVPMASVAGATRARRAVTPRMAATYPAMTTRKTISTNQANECGEEKPP